MRLLRRRIVAYATPLLALAILVPQADAQVTGRATYRVSVPRVVTIAAPAGAAIVHDETGGDQVFTAQQWTVAQNSLTGATVTFSTSQAFTNTVTRSSKRDARLDLTLASSDSSSGWVVLLANDQTSYESAREAAKVQATSTGPGGAALVLTVTFITDDVFTLTSGDYATTITGTITSN